MSRHLHSKPGSGSKITIDTLDMLSRDDLITCWRHHYRAEPPARIRRLLLELAVGWALQAQQQGGLSSAAERRLKAEAGNRKETRRPRQRLKPGTRLVREWHGTVHVVEVTEGGFHWQGQRCRSLSAIARAITGANWSGPRFFGLKGG